MDGRFTPPTRRNLSAPVVDRSGNDNGGNFATKETTDVTNYRVGEVIRPIGNAVWDFDGTDDAINIAASPSIQINTGSISFWVYFKAYDAGDLIQMAIGSGSYAQFYVRSNPLSWNYYFEGGYKVVKTLTSAEQSAFFPLSTWLNVCWVFDKKGGSNAESSVYINGDEAFSLTAGSTASVPWGTAGMTLGGYTWDGFTETKIAQYAMYNKVLTAQQVKENFNQQSSRFNVPNWRNRDIVQNGLKVWLDAGISESYSGSGTTWYDISGNNYDAALSGPAWDSSGYFVFDGSTDKAEIGSFPYTNFSTSGGGTIEIWYKMRGTANNGMLIDCCDPAGGGSPYTERDYFSIRTNWGGGDTAAYFKNNSDSFSDLSFTSAASGAAAVSNWVYIAYTVDINAVTTKAIYEYGVQVNSTTASIGSWNTNLSQILIGRDVLPGGNEVNANIAVVRVYGRALSASEIEQNFIVQRQRFGI